MVRRGTDSLPKWWISALYPPLAKKKIVVGMRFLATFDIMTILTEIMAHIQLRWSRIGHWGPLPRFLLPKQTFFRRQPFSWELGPRKISGEVKFFQLPGGKAARLSPSEAFGGQVIGATPDWKGQVVDRHDNQA
jgi:hypothetical protein